MMFPVLPFLGLPLPLPLPFAPQAAAKNGEGEEGQAQQPVYAGAPLVNQEKPADEACNCEAQPQIPYAPQPLPKPQAAPAPVYAGAPNAAAEKENKE